MACQSTYTYILDYLWRLFDDLYLLTKFLWDPICRLEVTANLVFRRFGLKMHTHVPKTVLGDFTSKWEMISTTFTKGTSSSDFTSNDVLVDLISRDMAFIHKISRWRPPPRWISFGRRCARKFWSRMMSYVYLSSLVQISLTVHDIMGCRPFQPATAYVRKLWTTRKDCLASHTRSPNFVEVRFAVSKLQRL